jgi:hypothetical protein
MLYGEAVLTVVCTYFR